MMDQLPIGLLEGKLEIPYQASHEAFQRLYRNFPYHFLMESKQVSLFSGRFSLIGVDPVLKITGKDDHFEIKFLNSRGIFFTDQFSEKDFLLCPDVKITSGSITGTIKKDHHILEEKNRPRMNNVAQVIRIVLEKFSLPKKNLLGLYGTLSYDFIRLFEDLQDKLPKNDINDFTFFLYDTFLYFDHIKEQAFIVCFREKEEEVHLMETKLQEYLQQAAPMASQFTIQDAAPSLTKEAFEAMVRVAKGYIRDGELVQVVFSNILKAKFEGDPFALYLLYRDKSPSPYLFYYQMGEEQLVGASPEMMVRCEEGIVHLRPIAGTARRGVDPIEDHDNLVELLKSPKERAELDMLIDLGRSDLSRICEPGIHLDDYRFVEKYSRVMHTVAHLSGKLRKGCTGLDALISCMNAGTLTGAPKISAMRIIEQHEQERRGYYGGAVGQLTFSGDVDTAIIIRTAHIRNGQLRYQSGAGIVYDSEPALEYQETLNKAQAFLETFANS
jgi:anthranilate synthase component 1